MKLKERILADKTQATRDSNKSLSILLGVVLGEIERRPDKNDSDEIVLNIIKKMVENSKICGVEFEITNLEKYLPTQITEEELETIITDFMTTENIESKKDIGKVMAHLKSNYNGQYDGKIASIIISKKLKIKCCSEVIGTWLKLKVKNVDLELIYGHFWGKILLTKSQI